MGKGQEEGAGLGRDAGDRSWSKVSEQRFCDAS